MRLGIHAAQVIVAGIAAAAAMPEAASVPALGPVAAPRAVAQVSVAPSPVAPACRDAVWPYMPAACGSLEGRRPVRVLRAEILR